jgi:hypothetical protein
LYRSDEKDSKSNDYGRFLRPIDYGISSRCMSILTPHSTTQKTAPQADWDSWFWRSIGLLLVFFGGLALMCSWGALADSIAFGFGIALIGVIFIIAGIVFIIHIGN